MPQYKTIRHLDPQPTIRVYTPDNPKKPAAVKLALRLQRLTMQQICRMGRRLVKKILQARVDNTSALAYLGSRFKQVSAEYRFRISKKP